MTESALTIGELARRTGCKVPTVRYYESIGLLPQPTRSVGNQRRYGPKDLARLGFIQHCREFGFSQSTIRGFLEVAAHPERSCESVTAVVQGHLEDVTEQMARLARLKNELERMIKSCPSGKVAGCQILEVLADHSHKHYLSDSRYR